jgi:hypothetical protein
MGELPCDTEKSFSHASAAAASSFTFAWYDLYESESPGVERKVSPKTKTAYARKV